MGENKTQNIQSSVKYYCRVCTTNTRSKKSKPGDGIGIFKKDGLKSILERYLQLQISENDALPKVICKSCFDKIEAVEFLRVMARRTETLLKDFLTNQGAQINAHNQFQNEYNTFAISMSTQRPPDKPEPQPEVVVNVSVSDPLTKDINKKLLVAQRRKDSLDKAFSPSQIGANAVTSSPNIAPLTIVHQMPRKKVPSTGNILEKRKNLQMALTNATTVTLEPSPPVTVTAAPKLPVRTKMASAPPPPPLRHISEAPAIPQKVEIHPVITAHTGSLAHAVTLGSIIKDEDLLRLILKALKWPFNNQTIDIQIQRLKNTNFGDIIVDPNLLQDADLIQILGPLIHPTMTAIPTSSQPQTYIAIPPEMSLQPSTISYKLPAETSVQIITVPPEEKTPPPKAPPKPATANVRTVIQTKKRRPVQKLISTGVIVVSDESEDDSLDVRTPEDIQRFELQLDPAMYQDPGENSNSNEAMLATLNRQREALMRVHRSKRKQSLIGANVEMVDDIMIVDEGVHPKEPYPDVVLFKKRRKTPPPPALLPVATTSTAKPATTVTQGTQVTQTVKKISPPIPQTVLVKAPPAVLPVKKVAPPPQPSIRKASQTEMPVTTKLPLKKDIQRIVMPQNQPITSMPNLKSTTLADADSTTKIVVKESKPPKDQKPSADIEEQITKVRIGKQVHKSTSSAQPEKKFKESSTKDDDDVVILVEGERKIAPKAAESVPPKSADKVEVVAPEKEATPKPKPVEKLPEEPPKKPEQSEIPSIEIKEEQPELPESSLEKEPLKEEETSMECDEKKDEDEELPERPKSTESDVSKVSIKTETRHTRSKNNSSSKPLKKPQLQTATTTFRPARRSKTLSKYYKGPPATSEGPGRSMRPRS